MVIGITGGIASGKSTVSSMLKELGAFIIDVDDIGRKVVEKGEKAYNEIVCYFGNDILLPKGDINRKKLGNIVFSSYEKLELLNSITHPEIIRRVMEEVNALAKDGAKIIVIDAAILFEMGLDIYCDSIWLVHVGKETQIKRLMGRDKFTYEEAIHRISSQRSHEERMKYIDVIIDNSQAPEVIKSRISDIWSEIKEGKE